jgi:hypothetical protein
MTRVGSQSHKKKLIIYLLTTTHCFTESGTKRHSRREHFSGDSSKVAAVQPHLK